MASEHDDISAQTFLDTEQLNEGALGVMTGTAGFSVGTVTGLDEGTVGFETGFRLPSHFDHTPRPFFFADVSAFSIRES